jgi:heterogeneous nuclear rnp K-like protein 2
MESSGRANSQSPTRSGSESPSNGPDNLTLRALVSTKDAGVIIGKAGRNVAELRDQTGVKAGVSKVVPGVHERVLTISGPVDRVAKAYALIVAQLVETNPAPPTSPTSPGAQQTPANHTSIRLLISHNLMGTIIGRSGLRIKQIQDTSGARMVATKEMLPQSTERVVEVHGSVDAIARAIDAIGRSLLEDWERGLGTVLYHPSADDARNASGSGGSGGGGGRPRGYSGRDGSFGGSAGDRRRSVGAGNGNASTVAVRGGSPDTSIVPSSSPPAGANLVTQAISIPSDMVGCIIGRGGSKITEIRRLSGSKISIAKAPHDETGERMFTIVGTAEANEKALFLLYNQLESEKERRVGRDNQMEE